MVFSFHGGSDGRHGAAVDGVFGAGDGARPIADQKATDSAPAPRSWPYLRAWWRPRPRTRRRMPGAVPYAQFQNIGAGGAQPGDDRRADGAAARAGDQRPPPPQLVDDGVTHMVIVVLPPGETSRGGVSPGARVQTGRRAHTAVHRRVRPADPPEHPYPAPLPRHRSARAGAGSTTPPATATTRPSRSRLAGDPPPPRARPAAGRSTAGAVQPRPGRASRPHRQAPAAPGGPTGTHPGRGGVTAAAVTTDLRGATR